MCDWSGGLCLKLSAMLILYIHIEMDLLKIQFFKPHLSFVLLRYTMLQSPGYFYHFMLFPLTLQTIEQCLLHNYLHPIVNGFIKMQVAWKTSFCMCVYICRVQLARCIFLKKFVSIQLSLFSLAVMYDSNRVITFQPYAVVKRVDGNKMS